MGACLSGENCKVRIWGFRITGKFENSMEAFNQAVSDPPDVIFIDIRMPEMDGLSFMRKAVEAGLPAGLLLSADLRNSVMPRRPYAWVWYAIIA